MTSDENSVFKSLKPKFNDLLSPTTLNKKIVTKSILKQLKELKKEQPEVNLALVSSTKSIFSFLFSYYKFSYFMNCF
jgi:hypothetical protein